MLGFSDLIPLFIASLVLALKPGPYVIAMTSLAAKGHFKAMFFFWIGAIGAMSVLYVIVLSGLNFISNSYAIIFLFLKAIAAMIFIGMGLKTLQENQDLSDEEIEERAKKISLRDALSNLLAGLTMGFSNPVDILFIFTAIPSLVSITVFSLRDIILIRGTVLLADILIITAYCLPLLLLHKKIPKQKLKILRVICGWAMVGIGIFLIGNILTQYDLIKSGLLEQF